MPGITAANTASALLTVEQQARTVCCPPVYRNEAGSRIEQGPMELLHQALFVFGLLRALEAATAEAAATTTAAAAVVVVVVVEEAVIR